MTELKQVYKCNICGNIVEVLHTGVGQLVCCGQPMELQKENTVDAAIEKHVPIIEKTDNGYLVKVGETQHPMTEDHYIEWIEFETKNRTTKKFLKPEDKPEIEVKCGEVISVRAYCNLHGLWKSTQKS